MCLRLGVDLVATFNLFLPRFVREFGRDEDDGDDGVDDDKTGGDSVEGDGDDENGDDDDGDGGDEGTVGRTREMDPSVRGEKETGLETRRGDARSFSSAWFG